MSVKDTKMDSAGYATWKVLTAPIGTTATGQTSLEVDEFRPGHDFEIESAEVYCTATAATASVNVLIGSTSVLSAQMTPSAGARVAGTLSTTIANRRGSATDNIVVQYTTNGTGSITNGKVRITYRPFPLNGEAMPKAGV